MTMSWMDVLKITAGCTLLAGTGTAAVTTIWTIINAGENADSSLPEFYKQEMNGTDCVWQELPPYPRFVSCPSDPDKAEAVKTKVDERRHTLFLEYINDHEEKDIIAPTVTTMAATAVASFAVAGLCALSQLQTEGEDNDNEEKKVQVKYSTYEAPGEACRKLSLNGADAVPGELKKTLKWDPRKFSAQPLIPDTDQQTTKSLPSDLTRQAPAYRRMSE